MANFGTGYLQGMQIAQMRRQKRRGEQLEQLSKQYFQQPSPSSLSEIATLDPARAMQIAEFQHTQQKIEQLPQQQQIIEGAQLSATILNTPQQARPLAYQRGLAMAEERGIDVSGMPKQYNQEAEFMLRDVINQARDIEKILEPREEPERKITKDIMGRQRYVDTGKLVFPEVKETIKPEALQKQEEKLFKRTQDIRKEYTKESSEFIDTRNSYNRVIASAEKPSAAGDIALLYNYMKMLDPRSTVREGEFATAQNAGAVPDWIRSRYNKVTKGEMLSENIRSDFLDRADKLYTTQEKTQKKLEKQYRNIAKKAGVDEEQAIIDLYRETEKEAKPAVQLDEADPRVQEALRQGYTREEIQQYLGSR